MTGDPTPEYLPADTDLRARFLACDPVSSGTGGTIYRAFAGTAYYVIIDTRRSKSETLRGIVGTASVVAMRFTSRDARERWLTEVLQSAATATNTQRPVPDSGSNSGGGAPLQPGLRIPESGKRQFDA